MSIEQRMRNLSFNLYKNGNIAGALALLGETECFVQASGEAQASLLASEQDQTA